MRAASFDKFENDGYSKVHVESTFLSSFLHFFRWNLILIQPNLSD